MEIVGNQRWLTHQTLETYIETWQAVVPLSHRIQVLRYAHDIKASGHLGVSKTLSKIRPRYYWPGLQNDVRHYISGCEKCSKRKAPTRTNAAPMDLARRGFPMERLALDILGELPVTESGNKYILVISDYFIKWTESFPMPNMEASTCARILVEEVIARFGVPYMIHSDQGRQIRKSPFKEMCICFKSKIPELRPTSHNPTGW